MNSGGEGEAEGLFHRPRPKGCTTMRTHIQRVCPPNRNPSSYEPIATEALFVPSPLITKLSQKTQCKRKKKKKTMMTKENSPLHAHSSVASLFFPAFVCYSSGVGHYYLKEKTTKRGPSRAHPPCTKAILSFSGFLGGVERRGDLEVMSHAGGRRDMNPHTLSRNTIAFQGGFFEKKTVSHLWGWVRRAESPHRNKRKT